MANQMNVFISYAHEDRALYKKLEISLEQIKGLTKVWSDERILAGSEWDKAIRQNLKDAQIILLLISPYFIASRYITKVEVRHAMERHESGEARVIPIILRPVLLDNMPYGKLQALPQEAKAVTTWKNRDDAFFHIIRGIQEAIKELNVASDIASAETRFNDTLMKLNFYDQKEVFYPFYANRGKEYLGAFIVHGRPDYGQFWLVNRLIKATGIENIDKEPFKFVFTAKGSSREPKALWDELRMWLHSSNSSTEIIIDEVYQLWQRQSVILKIRGIQNTRREDIEAFLHTFWEPLMQMIADGASKGQKVPNHYLLLFLVDNEGQIGQGQWTINWADQFKTPAIPVKLKEIQDFKDTDLNVWIDANKDDLPDILTTQVALADSAIPEDVLEKICMICGYEWFNQKGARW